MTKKQLVAIVLGICIACTAYLSWDIRRRRVEADKRFIHTTEQLSIKDYNVLGDNTAIFVDWKRVEISNNGLYKNERVEPKITSNFIVVPSFRLTELSNGPLSNRLSHTQAEPGEYIKLDIYRMDNATLEQSTIDVFKLIGDHTTEYTFSDFGPLYQATDGKVYLSILLQPFEKVWPIKGKWVFLDLQTHELKELGLSKGNQVEYSYNLDDVFETKFQEQGIRYYASERLVSLNFEEKIGVLPTSSTFKNSRIAKEYPNIYQGLMASEDIYFTSLTENVGEILDILELFYPESNDLYEGVMISEEYSVDGREHKINNREEFLKYYRSELEEELREEAP